MNEPDSYRAPPSMDNRVLERYLEHVEQKSKKWEKLVFPAMLAFILLASYGFFLINSLASDMRTISQVVGGDVQREIVAVSKDLHLMVEEVAQMRESVETMTVTIEPIKNMTPLLAEITKLDESVAGINQSVHNMDGSIQRMDSAIGNMDESMVYMGRDVDDMSDAFSSPMSMFTPW